MEIILVCTFICTAIVIDVKCTISYLEYYIIGKRVNSYHFILQELQLDKHLIHLYTYAGAYDLRQHLEVSWDTFSCL